MKDESWQGLKRMTDNGGLLLLRIFNLQYFLLKTAPEYRNPQCHMQEGKGKTKAQGDRFPCTCVY
ncbi:MAG: hypothetical protein FJY09_00705 [Chlorobi bacterium]|nr:hypothetical protein [Chlorobiota bacterium]